MVAPTESPAADGVSGPWISSSSTRSAMASAPAAHHLRLSLDREQQTVSLGDELAGRNVPRGPRTVRLLASLRLQGLNQAFQGYVGDEVGSPSPVNRVQPFGKRLATTGAGIYQAPMVVSREATAALTRLRFVLTRAPEGAIAMGTGLFDECVARGWLKVVDSGSPRSGHLTRLISGRASPAFCPPHLGAWEFTMTEKPDRPDTEPTT